MLHITVQLDPHILTFSFNIIVVTIITKTFDRTRKRETLAISVLSPLDYLARLHLLLAFLQSLLRGFSLVLHLLSLYPIRPFLPVAGSYIVLARRSPDTCSCDCCLSVAITRSLKSAIPPPSGGLPFTHWYPTQLLSSVPEACFYWYVYRVGAGSYERNCRLPGNGKRLSQPHFMSTDSQFSKAQNFGITP